MRRILYLLLVGLPAHALAQGPLSLDSCLKAALRSNRSLEAAGNLSRIADADLRAARLAQAPDISANGLAVYGAPSMLPAMPGLWSAPLSNFYVGALQVSQPIYAGGRLRNSAQAAKIASDMSHVGIAMAADSVAASITVAYWQIVAMYRLGEILSAQRGLLERIRTKQRDLQAAGMSLENDRLKVEVQIDALGLDQMRLGHRREAALRQLCALMRMEYSESLRLLDTLPETSPPPMRPDTSLTGSRRFSISRQRVELARLAVQIELGGARPAVSAGAAVGNLGRFGPGAGGRTLGIGFLSLTVPLSGWWTSARTAAAKGAELVSLAEIEHETVATQLRLGIIQSWHEWLEAREEVMVGRKMAAQASAALRSAIDNYSSGLADTSEVLEAEALHRRAEGQLAASLAALIAKQAAYRYALQN